MNTNEAMNMLNLSGEVSQTEIKKAYKAASIKYHPDRNPAGAEMMKAINEAYELLSKLGDSIKMEDGFNAYDYAEELNAALNQLLELEGLIIEVCGNWIWITGETKKHKAALGRDGIGCFYAKKKQAWYYRPAEYKSRSRKSHSMDEIRDMHGSIKVDSNSGQRRFPSTNKKALAA